VARGKVKERNPKIKKLLINSYQSHLFNLWLSRRLEINKLIESFSVVELEPMLNISKHTLEMMKAQKHPFKIMMGDVIEHYPHGRLFNFEGDAEDIKRFDERAVSVTGLLCGKKAWLAKDEAYTIEKEYNETISADGARRYAWIFPEGVEGEYKEEEAWFELHFSLPKGSYATVLIEEIAKREIK
jgi:tRNA pseudouridine13 synthase